MKESHRSNYSNQGHEFSENPDQSKRSTMCYLKCEEPQSVHSRRRVWTPPTTGDCVVTECPDNYRVSEVGALGKQYLPSVNTRKTKTPGSRPLYRVHTLGNLRQSVKLQVYRRGALGKTRHSVLRCHVT